MLCLGKLNIFQQDLFAKMYKICLFFCRETIQKNWRSIRTWFRAGPIRHRYNFYLNGGTIQAILTQIFNAIISTLQCTFKINYSFGYILKNRVTGECRYFHPSNGRFR